MLKYLITALVFLSVVGKAQKPIDYLSVDSLTYRYYITGEWARLIDLGNQAVDQKIDYKKLRQRIGYAYFMEGDYYSAQQHYEKALAYDSFDADTRAYLYFSALNTGNETTARFQADKLPLQVQQNLNIQQFKLIDAIDFEFNYKSNNSGSRSNPTYLRFGINTFLSYRLSLYQSYSNYSQSYDTGMVIKQPEYYALLTWSATPHSSVNLAYHYLNTTSGGVNLPGNMFYGSYDAKINRFHLGLNGSVISNSQNQYTQLGLQGGFTLPGYSNLNFTTSISNLKDNSTSHTIFSQTVGARLAKTLWGNVNMTVGNLNFYNDFNALYVYNSIDPTLFRIGVTLFWYLGKHITLTANYTYDTKKIELTQLNYIQQSFLGGIRCKL